jgi:hypothetical protein
VNIREDLFVQWTPPADVPSGFPRLYTVALFATDIPITCERCGDTMAYMLPFVQALRIFNLCFSCIGERDDLIVRVIKSQVDSPYEA